MIERPRYLNKIRPFVGKDVVKVLTGVRRCGKSTLLEMVREELNKDEGGAPNVYLNFESSEFDDMQDYRDLNEYVHAHITPGRRANFFLDEVQEIDGWEKTVRSLRVDYDADIYLTGSNARMLSSDLSSLLTGRYVTISVQPLSFAEFASGYRELNPDVGDAECFRQYLVLGGFPFLQKIGYDRQACMQYLQDVFATVLLKDIVQHGQIRDAELLERVVRYVLSESGHPFSAKSIADFLKSERRSASVETIQNYLHAAERAFLLYRIPREDATGKRVLRSNEKIYAVDHGLRQMLGYDNLSNIDQVLENIIALELLGRGYQLRAGRVGEKEIDFIAEKGTEVRYYQVARTLASSETREREFAPLLAKRDNYPKAVLTLDEFAGGSDGIPAVNLIEWLLGARDA